MIAVIADIARDRKTPQLHPPASYTRPPCFSPRACSRPMSAMTPIFSWQAC